MAIMAGLGTAYLVDYTYSSDDPNDDEYLILEEISRGTYGVVYKARNEKTGEIVAMKEEVGGLCPSTLMEISILKSLPRHPCIVGFKQAAGGERAYVVMEHMMSDLKRWRQQTLRALGDQVHNGGDTQGCCLPPPQWHHA